MRYVFRYFSVLDAYEEGLVDKLVPGYKLNRFRKMVKDQFGSDEPLYAQDKPRFKFTRQSS
jgi:ATP-dependent Clp protease, protease subunit